MPDGLERFYGNRDLHFITCSCNHRRPLLGTPERRDAFLAIMEEVRQRYQFSVAGYVVVPEHFHWLVTEPDLGTPSTVMQVLKQRFAQRMKMPIWQERFYDFNVWSERKRVEKLDYIHQNPLRRGLVAKPEDWHWNSFRWYSLQESGPVTMNC